MAIPSLRFAAAAGYHTGVTKAFLFGGRSLYNDQILGDTWQWSAGAWTLLAPAASPSPRFGAAMAYHAGTTKLVLFGGRINAGGDAALSDTWTFDGTVWLQAAPAASPPARHDHLMTIDSTGQIVLFGGYGNPYNNAPMGDTWGWNGSTWTQLA